MITTKIVNIASALDTMAEKQPFKPAIIFPEGRDKQGNVSYTHYTFQKLVEESNKLASGLEKIGIGRGCRTVLMVKPGLDFFALTFALFKAGIVPILIDPGMGIKNLKICLKEAEPEAFIGITKAHIAREILGWSKDTIKTKVTVGKKLFWDGYTLEEVKSTGKKIFKPAETTEDEIAAILFTSGSTGVPKGVVYNHGNFVAQVEAIKKIYDIQPGEINLPTFPLFALFDPALGMTTVIPDMDATRPAGVDPLKIIEAIENFGVTNMFGSPALINTVGRYGKKNNIKLPSLRRVISAGAPVQASVLEKFASMLAPEAKLYTPYGATECLPVCSIDSTEIIQDTKFETEKGKGVCIGKPVKDLEVAIIRTTDDPIEYWDESLKVPDGTIGEIVVRGRQVTRAYYNRENSNKLAKIYDKNGAGLFHRMGDLGYFDEKGRIWFCGRKAHRVETETETLYTVNCEHVFNVHSDVYRTALVGVKKDKTIPVLCVELEEEAREKNKEKIAQELLEIGSSYPHTAGIKEILFHKSFPVDIRHNAKIFREKLAGWAQKELGLAAWEQKK